MEKHGIYAIPGNKEILEHLKELVREKRLVPFIGAGFSAPACPGWGDFLKEFYEGLKRDRLLKTGEEEEFEALSKATDNPYEKMADLLFRSGEKKPIQEAFGKRIEPGMLKKFHLLNHVFTGLKITTNYDYLIEENCPGSHVEVCRGNRREDLKRLMVNYNQNSLLKIHGGLRDPKTMVLTSTQYEKVYGHKTKFSNRALLPQLLNTICTTFSLFFIGCSLYEDRTLMVMEKIEYKQPHYAVMMLPEKNDDKVDVIRRLKRHGIEPLWVTDWTQIEEILEILRGSNKTRNDGF